MPKSVCSCGDPVSLYYFDGPRGKHIEHAVEVLMAAINDQPHRYLGNQMLQDEAYGVFVDLLELAEEGRLRIPEYVKQIHDSPEIDMFEIRWTTIPVIDVDPVSGLFSETKEVHVRLYMVEVGEPWAVGVHVHEKDLDGNPATIRMRQGQAIQQAAKIARDYRSVAWKVPELSPRSF